MVIHGSTESAQNLNSPGNFDNHRAAWTAGGSINKFLRVNRKKIDTQKVTVLADLFCRFVGFL